MPFKRTSGCASISWWRSHPFLKNDGKFAKVGLDSGALRRMLMIAIRRSEDRGKADRGWLNARFSFSFADYFDSKHVGFRVLQVLNDDWIAPGRGFGPHAHRDMEIIT